MEIVADRAFTSRATLQRVESGATTVSISIYASVLQALGLLDGLSPLADIGNDVARQALARADLPKHIHLKRGTASKRHGWFRDPR